MGEWLASCEDDRRRWFGRCVLRCHRCVKQQSQLMRPDLKDGPDLPNDLEGGEQECAGIVDENINVSENLPGLLDFACNDLGTRRDVELKKRHILRSAVGHLVDLSVGSNHFVAPTDDFLDECSSNSRRGSCYKPYKRCHCCELQCLNGNNEYKGGEIELVILQEIGSESMKCTFVVVLVRVPRSVTRRLLYTESGTRVGSYNEMLPRQRDQTERLVRARKRRSMNKPRTLSIIPGVFRIKCSH